MKKLFLVIAILLFVVGCGKQKPVIIYGAESVSNDILLSLAWDELKKSDLLYFGSLEDGKVLEMISQSDNLFGLVITKVDFKKNKDCYIKIYFVFNKFYGKYRHEYSFGFAYCLRNGVEVIVP